jgi:putative endonuclease
MDARSERGAGGEAAAAAWYAARGFQVEARNWRCRAGEIDLVVVHGALLVICEVKTRRGHAFGGGFEAVGWEKQRKLRQLAELFFADRAMTPHSVRFDVASVTSGARGWTVEVFEDAF